jgi:predicted Fe-Mo cluster-binding NifX family protein
MAKIGEMMSENRADEKMSSHFGKAEWIMISDSGSPVISLTASRLRAARYGALRWSWDMPS